MSGQPDSGLARTGLPDGELPGNTAGPAATGSPGGTMRPEPGNPPRWLRVPLVLRAGYGAALLCSPAPLIRACTRRTASPRARTVARVLGGRHLAQAALLTGAGTDPLWLAGSAAVDIAHALSMAALAAADRRVRAAALADALIAAAFAAAGLAGAAACRTAEASWPTMT